MIVSMKKISVVVQAKDAEGALARLRSLGIVHVEHAQPPQGAPLAQLREDLAMARSARDILSEPVFRKLKKGQQKKPSDWRFVAKHTVELYKRLQQLEDYSHILLARIKEWERWGDFDPDAIEALKNKNIYLRFYQIPVKELNLLPEKIIVQKIFTEAGIAYCMIASFGKVEIPFKELSLPKMSLTAMRERLYEDDRMIDLITDDICRYLVYDDALADIEKELEKQLEFSAALHGMGQAGALVYLSGYVPYDAIKPLTQAAQQERWGLLIRDPSDEDTVPTLLRNPRWIAVIRPVLELLGVLPGYHELDVSFVFLFFFSIFFGILIGDAGYGLIYFGLTLWLEKKKGAKLKNKNIFFLAYILSSCAMIWGVLTGTFFGQEWLAARNVRPLIPALNDPSAMQAFCFLLGAIHLSIAHGWRALLKFPSQQFLADLGWIAVLWVGYFLARTLILAQPFPDFGLPAALGAITLILFFSEPRKNVLKRLGAGFLSVTFGLSFMSAFTDVVSYVRLFAVGLAGVAIANTTNTIAAGLGPGIVAFACGILITILGHALNIVLGPIAVLVHGVRLNVLEFGVNHTGITWSGKFYQPFA